jgi:hypothetical protein
LARPTGAPELAGAQQRDVKERGFGGVGGEDRVRVCEEVLVECGFGGVVAGKTPVPERGVGGCGNVARPSFRVALDICSCPEVSYPAR